MLLSDKQLIYEKIFDKITLDQDIGKISEEEANKLKKELNNSFELNRYCCKQRFMTYKRLIEIIK
jgi:DNA-directed RNA polymerase subunit N (RpoN/RPB10)